LAIQAARAVRAKGTFGLRPMCCRVGHPGRERHPAFVRALWEPIGRAAFRPRTGLCRGSREFTGPTPPSTFSKSGANRQPPHQGARSGDTVRVFIRLPDYRSYLHSSGKRRARNCCRGRAVGGGVEVENLLPSKSLAIGRGAGPAQSCIRQ
jgi:hypothetical protein